MSEIVTYQSSGSIARITMDDGKANAMSPAMLQALHAAFDRAEREKAVVILTGREKTFSAGFDLKVFAMGTAEDIHGMLKAGAELALRVLTFPTPVVTACNGNAYPMGAFLMLAADVRIGADGPFKIGMNEVTIGLAVPGFGLEVARQRMLPAYFNRAAVTGEMFAPREAMTAGFLDQVVAPEELQAAADQMAASLTKIDMAAHAATKQRARAGAAKAVRAAIDTEVTLEFAQAGVARRNAMMARA